MLSLEEKKEKKSRYLYMNSESSIFVPFIYEQKSRKIVFGKKKKVKPLSYESLYVHVCLI